MPAACRAARRDQRDGAFPRAGRARAGGSRGAAARAARHNRRIYRRASSAARPAGVYKREHQLRPHLAAHAHLHADQLQNAHDLVPEPRRSGAAQGTRKEPDGHKQQFFFQRSHLADADGASSKFCRLPDLFDPVPLARPRADSDRPCDRGAQLPRIDARRKMELQPARGGGQLFPAHGLCRFQSQRPRDAQGYPHLRHGALAARRLHRRDAHVPALFVPPAARLLSERPRGRRADLSAQRRFLRLPAVFDAAKRPLRL